MNIQEALKTLTNETGWTMPKAGADGVFRFHLEDGLELALLSPDGRLCILTSDLGEAPSENDPEKKKKSDRLGTVCAALMPHGRATLSTANERLELVRAFSLDGLADLQMSELSCHAKGATYLFPDVHTVVDIGGQDVKVIEIENGMMKNFVMNDKCAAGTGRFLDVMARVLEVRVEDLGDLGDKSTKEIGISSVRGGSIVGDHEVLFCGPDEVITLKHTAYSRSVFANGAINAAVYLAKKEPGLYNMGNMIAEL